MIETLLAAAAIPSRQARYHDAPQGTYGIWFDEAETDGADDVNCLLVHNGTVELYAPEPDKDAEAAFEAELDARGIHWSKQGWYWMDNLKRYQNIYEFSYIEKRRN